MPKKRKTKAKLQSPQPMPDLCPIMTLPAEIISEIFVLSTPDEFGFNTNLNKMSTLPFLLTCHRWSEIALNTSSIWCYYTLEPRPRHTRAIAWRSDIPSDAVTSRLQTWLQRARGAPIHVYCIGLWEQSVWNILLDKIAQWGSLEIRAVSWDDLDLTHSKAVQFLEASGSAVALQRLALDMHHPFLPTSHKHIARFIEDDFVIALPSLTSLDLGRDQVQLLAKIRAPQLKDLSLDELSIEVLGDFDSRFPNLRAVQLYFERTISPISIFNKAYTLLPNVVQWDVIVNGTMYVDLTSLSNATYPKVMSLSFDRFRFSVPEGNRFLSMFPNVERISIGYDATALLECLISDKLPDLNLTLPLVCPRLRSICLEGSQVNKRTLLEFSQTRAPKPEDSTVSRKGKAVKKKSKFEHRCLLTLRSCVLGNGHKIPDAKDLDEHGVVAVKCR